MEQSEKILLRSSSSEDTTPEMGLLLGHALALDHKKVIIGMDLMKSSPMMKSALVAGLTSSGADVIDIGVVSGPVIAVAANNGDCAVYITEFRDPELVSGYLLFNPDGSLFRKDQIRHLERIFIEKSQMPDFKGIGTVRGKYDATHSYKKKALSLLDEGEGGSMILNCSCGTATDTAPQILNTIGTDLISINAQKDRDFISNSLSTKEADIRQMKAIIQSNPGCIGVSLNRIGTLMRVFDENGDPIPDEYVLALLILYLRPRKVVMPMDMTRFIEAVVTGGFDTEVVTPHEPLPEGEAELILARPDAGVVCSLVKENDADLGYYDGGFIFGKMSLMSDAVFASALLSQISGNNTLALMISKFPEYFTESKSYRLECSKDDFVRMLNDNISELDPVRSVFDECWRIDFEDGWFCISFDDDQDDVVNVKMESNDRAYLIGLMELVDGLMEKSLKGQ